MATRTLKQPRERILTAILSHYMVCGARLPVFILIAAAFFQQNAINVVFILYLLGLLVAILVGLLLKSTILAGDNQGFIIELPDYQWPSFSSIFSHTLFKVKQFIFGAGKTIVIVVTLLGFFSSLGTDGTFDNQGSDKAVLSVIGQQITPILAPMGIEQDNWQATVGIFTGLFAKEVLVATLNTLYLAEQAEVEDATIETKLRQALDSVAANLKSVSEYVTDPLGLSAANVSSAEEAAQALDVNLSALQTMQAKFNGQLGAFAYLVFILLYAPCASALGAYSREFGGRWTTFIAVFTTGVAFLIASLVYQVGQWQNSKFSVVIIVLVAVAAYWLLKQQRLADWLKPEQRHVTTTANPACHS